LLEKIKNSQPVYNLFIRITEGAALQAAEEAEKRMMKGNLLSVVDGVPFGVKDLMYTKGIPTTMGCDIYRDFVPGFNAEVIGRMCGGGSVLMGKLNTHQFALGPTGDRSSAGPARNPRNPQKITGGSSSGSAGAVAAELLPVSLGTDTGGSIRIPSHYCGVVGMKPTYGRVSIRGIMPLSADLDHAGPLTRTVRDNAAVLNVIAGYDPCDEFSRNIPVSPDYAGRIGEPVKGAVIGVPYSLFSDTTEPAVLSLVSETIRILEKQGAAIREITFPGGDEYEEYRKAHSTMLETGAYTVHEKDIREHPEMIAPEILDRMRQGNIPAPVFVRSTHARLRFRRLVQYLMKGIDIIMMPSLPNIAVDIGTQELTVCGKKTTIREASTRFTWQGNFLGFPALSLPCGTVDKLPAGVQIIGHEWDEENVYRFAAELEKALS
jgi:aspartyl-tRNA(Asn)/glutamyl-tRNA(Gln) amidotransferase subunit A